MEPHSYQHRWQDWYLLYPVGAIGINSFFLFSEKYNQFRIQIIMHVALSTYYMDVPICFRIIDVPRTCASRDV